MPYLVNHNAINRMALGVQRIEQQLADALYQVFNDRNGDALRNVQATARNILSAMNADRDRGPLVRALQRESRLDVLKTHAPLVYGRARIPEPMAEVAVKTLLVKVGNFTAADCSDIIRLAGEWIEQRGFQQAWAGPTVRGTTAAAEVKQAFRPGMKVGSAERSAFPAKVEKSGLRWQSGAIQEKAAWADAKPDTTLQATYGEDFTGMTQRREREDAPKGQLYPLPRPIHKRPGQGVAGRQLKKVAGNSNVLKLDRLFGLSELCDISGTTADSTAAMELWSPTEKVNVVHKGKQYSYDAPSLGTSYHLLPLATMPSGAHHSILEVALTLSLNDIMSYRIGFYHTLLPTVSDGSRLRQRLSGLFSEANRNVNGGRLHFLRFYGHKVYGGLVFAPEDIVALRESRLCEATALLGVMPSLPSKPGPGTVFHLVQRLAPGLVKPVYSVMSTKGLIPK